LPEVICDTSPIQYLHQAGQLSLLPALAQAVTIPTAVDAELRVGRQLGVNLPDPASLAWIQIHQPASTAALALVRDLGPGESGVLALALESPDAMVVLDDALARRVALSLGLRIRGTLGVLLDAKARGIIRAVRPILDDMVRLGFRLSPDTRAEILRRAGEP
jgi:uncharacterized protein